MLRIAPALVLIGLFTATDAHAVNVCGYYVKGALGFHCPVKTGAIVCASVNANTGNDCQNTQLCFGGLLCQMKLVPFTGPQKACPFQSTRLRGFSCFAPIKFPTRPPTGTPTSTPTATEIPFTPTGTPTGTAAATATATTAPTATDTAEPEATATNTVAPLSTATSTSVPPATATNTAVPPVTATNTSVPPPSTATSTATEEAEATATATGTATGTAAATVTNTVAPPATPTNTVAPPATSTNTVAPPATATNTVAPPATSTNTVAPPATSTNTVAPPATSTNTVAPPATATNTVAPPATSTNTVAPPATATNTAVPPATSTNTAVPPATATNTVVPPATATNTAVPPATSTNTSIPSTATATRTNVPSTATSTNTVVPPTATATASATATSTATTAPIVCPITAGRYTITQTTGGTLRVATFAAFPFPSGGTLIQDVDAGDSQCVHNSVIPFPNGLNVPLFCVPALGATTMVSQTGCGVGRIDSNGGSDFTIAENGDTSETTVCNVPQLTCPASGPAPDSSGRLDITVGNGMVDVCTGTSTANAAATVPVNTLTWVAADASCPDSDGMFNPDTDTKLAEFPQTLDFTTDVTSARFTDISGDGCQKSGLGPNGPFTETGVCIDLVNNTVTTVAAGTVFSSGGPTYDLLFSSKLPSTISGPAQSGGAVCGNPPTINFNGTATRCLVGP